MNEQRLQQQLRTFDTILTQYGQDVPLARFLTQYFKENKQMGSNDRRTASRLLYNFFRVGRALPAAPPRERLAIAEYLCLGDSDFARLIFPQLESDFNLELPERIRVCKEQFGFQLETIFPLVEKISDQIEKEQFLLSHFTQPDLFIRIHTAKTSTVKATLEQSGIFFKEVGPHTLSFPNGTKLDQVHSIQGKYEVQDFSSQQTGGLFMPSVGESWWDACAGSGGKSILLKQQESQIDLLVSDSRNSILRNLDERFDKAGITAYRRKIIDITKKTTVLNGELFDGIILDAPCSGSGTWGRTPEMMTLFKPQQLQYYADLQKTLALNVLQHIKAGKPLIYITCSVFEEENEQVIQFLEKEGMRVEEARYFKGYENKADTLFAARLIR